MKQTKQLLLLLALAFNLSASSQMSSLFYGSATSALPALADSIKAALPGYKLDTVETSKSGRTITLLFWNASGSKLEAQILKAGSTDDKITTIQVSGSKEAILALWSHSLHFPTAEASSMPVQVITLASGQRLPVACFQDTAKQDRWILASRNTY
jgi:hypothetical protein